MKTKSLTAAQIDTLAGHLSEAPVAPSASAKKAGDTLAQLLVAGIGEERAALAFTSVMSADTFDQAEARLILVLKYGNTDPANDTTRAIAEEPAAAIAPVIGKRQAILDQAQTGALPVPPDFSKPTHAHFRAKLAQIVVLSQPVSRPVSTSGAASSGSFKPMVFMSFLILWRPGAARPNQWR